MAGSKRAGAPGWRTPPGLYWALGLAVFVQLLEFYGWLASPEGGLLNLFLGRIPLRAATSPANIATLEVDDLAFDQCFGGHSPMNPESIKKLVDRALEARPRAVGVDIITDSGDADYLEAYRNLEEHFHGEPVVWAAGADKTGEGESFIQWSLGGEPIAVQPTAVLGKEREPDDLLRWGLPIYPHDEDLRLRRFPREAIVPPGQRQLNWASQVAQLRCAEARQGCTGAQRDELFISFAGDAVPKDQKFKMLDLFDCTPRGNVTPKPPGTRLDQFHAAATDVVLVGGTFSSARDSYPTPRGVLDGLYFNAYAVQAEIAGTGVSDVPPLGRLVGDVFLGMTMGWIFRTEVIKSRKLNIRILWCVALLAGVLALSAGVLYPFKYVWLSCVGIAVGMTIHLLIEIWKEDLALPAHKSHSGGAPRRPAHGGA